MGSWCNPFMSASLACDGQTTRVFNLNPVMVSRPNLLLSVLPMYLIVVLDHVHEAKEVLKICVCVFNHVNLTGNIANMHIFIWIICYIYIVLLNSLLNALYGMWKPYNILLTSKMIHFLICVQTSSSDKHMIKHASYFKKLTN